MARNRRVLRGERYVCDSDSLTVYISATPDFQLSIQQPSQRGQHSLSGIDLFDLMKVLVSGAMISRMMYGLCFFFLFTAHVYLYASYGLPTRSRQVSEFMMGLEKTKARAGEISSSARALTLEDMHHLYDQCFRPSATAAEMRQGIVRYVSGYFAQGVRLPSHCTDMPHTYFI